jgi:hypothetical protein
MTIGETVRKALKELSESILNSITLDFKLDDGAVTKPKRARTKKGTYKADDKSTPNVNEAWVGGKAPKKKAKRKTKRKK